MHYFMNERKPQQARTKTKVSFLDISVPVVVFEKLNESGQESCVDYIVNRRLALAGEHPASALGGCKL